MTTPVEPRPLWYIIKSKMKDGTFEYQVSDGKVGERTVSYDFNTLAEAKKEWEKLI